jgi:hypothetical protein
VWCSYVRAQEKAHGPDHAAGGGGERRLVKRRRVQQAAADGKGRDDDPPQARGRLLNRLQRDSYGYDDVLQNGPTFQELVLEKLEVRVGAGRGLERQHPLRVFACKWCSLGESKGDGVSKGHRVYERRQRHTHAPPCRWDTAAGSGRPA